MFDAARKYFGNKIVRSNDITYLKRKIPFCSGCVLSDRFESPENFAKLAGLNFKARRKITNELIIKNAKEIFSNDKNKNITRCQFYDLLYKKCRIRRKTIFERFGRLDNLAKLCNFNFIQKINFRKEFYYEKKDILFDLQKIFRKYPKLKKTDLKQFYGKEIRCYKDCIMNKFGSLENAAKLCNYEFKSEQYFIKEKLIKKLKNAFDNRPEYFIKSKLKNFGINSNALIRYFGSTDAAAKRLGYSFSIPTRKYMKFPFLGKNETNILNSIEQKQNIKLKRQYSVYTYFVDGYDEYNNVVYEVDEYHHRFRKEYDIKRDSKIKEMLNCKIVRINEKDFLKQHGGVEKDAINSLRTQSSQKLVP